MNLDYHQLKFTIETFESVVDSLLCSEKRRKIKQEEEDGDLEKIYTIPARTYHVSHFPFQTGDVILASNSGFLSSIIQTIIKSPINHAAIVYVDPILNIPYIWDQQGSKPELSSLDKYIERSTKSLFVRPLNKPIDNNKFRDAAMKRNGHYTSLIVALVDLHMKNITTGYNSLPSITHLVPRNHRTTNCTNFFINMFIELGVIQQTDAIVFPSDLAKSDLSTILPFINGYELGPIYALLPDNNRNSSHHINND